MQNRTITLQFIKADQEKQALDTIMEAIYYILHDESSFDAEKGENNDNFTGSS